MELSAPKTITFLIAVILVILGLASHYGVIAATTPYAFVLLIVGFFVLAVGNVVRGL